MTPDQPKTWSQWWLAHPWHVTGTLESGKVPPDCDCDGCKEKRTKEEETHTEPDYGPRP